MSTSAAAPARVAAREREAKALDLRAGGKKYWEIGDALGMTEQGAWACVKRAMKALGKENGAKAERLRALEAHRLDMLLAAVWPGVEAGELGAVDRALRISESRRRLLGLDLKPPDITVEGPQIVVVEARPPWEREPEANGVEVEEAEIPAIPARLGPQDGPGAGGNGGVLPADSDAV